MHQIIIKSNQNKCCLPIIDIEEKFMAKDIDDNNENKINLVDKTTASSINNDAKEIVSMEKNRNLEEKQSFEPKAFMCFCGSDNKENLENKIGVTFAQDAKNYHKETLSPDDLFKQSRFNRSRKKIYVRNLDAHKSIPVINTGISGSRYIYDNNSLLDYCMKWCKSVYFGRVILRAIHNTGTLLLIFPGQAMYFVQFVYGKSDLTETQRKFQKEISPVQVLEFHSFVSFSIWMKKQIILDS